VKKTHTKKKRGYLGNTLLKKKTVAFGSTGEKESEQKVLQLITSRSKRKKKLIYTQKKNKPIEAKTFGALTIQFQINYLFFELETGWNNGGMKKKSIRINRPD